MESPIKWIMSKISPVKVDTTVKTRYASKEKTRKSGQTPEKKIKKVRVL